MAMKTPIKRAKNKAAKRLGELSRAKRVALLVTRGITESEHMRKVRNGGVHKSKKAR